MKGKQILTALDDAWIEKCGAKKVGYYKKGDDCLNYGDGVVKVFVQATTTKAAEQGKK